MVVVMLHNSGDEEIKKVVEELEKGNCEIDLNKNSPRIMNIIGEENEIDFDKISSMHGVECAYPIQKDINYPLASRIIGKDKILPDALIEIKGDEIEDIRIGGNRPTYLAGPCAVESKEQMRIVAESVAAIRDEDKYGQYGIRGGCYKPRTGAHGFTGLGKEGLRILDNIRKEYKLPIITEVRSQDQIKKVSEISDILQIGARNSQNQDLLAGAGNTGKPVLYKRGKGMDIEEWLRGTGHIIKGGNGGIDRSNRNILLCERGEMPTGGDSKFLRYPSQMQAGQVVKYETYLPAIFDPSHSAGSRRLVPGSSIGAMAMGYDGLLIEVHPNPGKAMTDANQQITPNEFRDLVKKCNDVHRASHKYLKENRDKWFRERGYKIVD